MSDFETREADWLPFEEALARVQMMGRPRPAAERPLDSCMGLAVARDVDSKVTLPPGPTSHMDGYALRAGDLTSDGDGLSRGLSIVGTSRPGSPWAHPMPPGSAVRIMTGALLPEGADTVVPVERTDRSGTSGESVQIITSPGAPLPSLGSYVRPAGEEVREGEPLAREGDTVTPWLLALLAVTGDPTIPVFPPPKVQLLVTGDELVPAGDPTSLLGGVRRADILSPTLPELVRQAGGSPLEPVRVPDDADALRAAFHEAASSSDLVVTTGGASMGDADLVKRVLDELGFELDFWRVKMRPGSPFSLGWIPRTSGEDRVPVLGLPGNPVSALVTFLTLGAPAVRALGGHRRRHPPSLRAVARETLSGPGDLTCFLRVTLDPEDAGGWGARPSASQGSGAVRNLARADALAVLPEGTESVAAGESVIAWLLPKHGWPEGR